MSHRSHTYQIHCICGSLVALMTRPNLPSDPAPLAERSSWALPYATKAELVYQHLRDMIVSGALLPGERLYLDEIAQRLGVSTNPVREALRRLESEGLIANRPHAGATVAALDVEKIEVHFLIRGALEGLAVRLAASRMTEETLERLEEWDGRLARLAASGEHATWNEENIAFHRFLFGCSRAPDLVALIDLQRDRSPRYRHFPEVLAERARESDGERRALLAALRARDGAEAERLQRQIAERVGELLCSAMRQAGVQGNAKTNGALTRAGR